jgi:acyl carrier protein
LDLTEDQVTADVIDVIREMAGDWQYTGPLKPETRMYADMEIQSLDFVTLASAMVNRYGPIPFDDFYAQLGEQPPETREVTIGQFSEFVYRSLNLVHETALEGIFAED